MTQTIALVDDDRNILTSISIALEKEGFKVQTYLDGESALIGLSRTPPDLAIIDIKMPKMDGEELLKKLRKKTSLPVIFLTSKDEEVDELLGLKLGADDFVKKSGGFSIKVLIERIRVQLRKKNVNIEDTKNIINHGKLKLDPSQLECEWGGKQLPDKLTTTEFLIVQELAKRPGIIKERAQLMDIAYREDTDIEDRTIDSHVKRIRKKFKKVDENFQERIQDPKILEKLSNESNSFSSSDFLIGNEESGHLLSLTRIPNKEGRMIPAYAGNGLKTGLNSLMALESLRPSDPLKLIEWLNEKFPRGYSRSLPVYHVKQELLEPQSLLRNELKGLIEQVLEANGHSIEWHHRSQEPNMLMGLSLKNHLPELCVFVRNSGTEDKLSLYFRSLSNNREMLESVINPIYGFLLKNFKDPSKSSTQLEQYILRQLKENPLNLRQIQNSAKNDSTFQEIFRLMHSRQSLICLLYTSPSPRDS